MKITKEKNKIIIEFEEKDSLEIKAIVRSQIDSLFCLIDVLEGKN